MSTAQAPVAVGVDVGGTKLAAGVVDRDGEILLRARREVASPAPDDVVAAIGDLVDELADAMAGEGREVIGVGIGLPAFIDAARSHVFAAPNLGWRNVPARSLLESRLGRPVVLENDANAAAWGEARFGAGAGCAELLVVTIGTGVGGGIVTGGRLLRGYRGTAGEVGHMTMVPGGLSCGCGQQGCWEQYASGSALVRLARARAAQSRDEAHALMALGDGTPEGILGVHITAAAQAGDSLAISCFTELGDAIGMGLASLSALLDPQRIVIGGGVSEAGDLLLHPVVQAFQRYVQVAAQRDTMQIVLASLRNDAGLIGAADLAFT